MKKKKPAHGGSRPGAGRPVVEDKKVSIWFTVRESRMQEAKKIIQPIVEKLNQRFTENQTSGS